MNQALMAINNIGDFYPPVGGFNDIYPYTPYYNIVYQYPPMNMEIKPVKHKVYIVLGGSADLAGADVLSESFKDKKFAQEIADKLNMQAESARSPSFIYKVAELEVEI